MHTTVRSRIIIVMAVLVLANAATAVVSRALYVRAAAYGAASQAAERRAGLAAAASDRVTAFSADAGTLAFAALQSRTSEAVSRAYGDVVGSEQSATHALQRLAAAAPGSSTQLGRQWDGVRLATYVWVNAEASQGGAALRIRNVPGQGYRASVESNLATPVALQAMAGGQMRDEVRSETAVLRDATLRSLVVASQQAADQAAAAEDLAARQAQGVTVALVLATLVLAVVGAVWLYRSIATPLARARSFADRVAQGDLYAMFESHRADEIGALTHAVENMRDAVVHEIAVMREMAGAVLITAEELRTAASHASGVAQASGAELASDLGEVQRHSEVLSGLAVQMIEQR